MTKGKWSRQLLLGTTMLVLLPAIDSASAQEALSRGEPSTVTVVPYLGPAFGSRLPPVSRLSGDSSSLGSNVDFRAEMSRQGPAGLPVLSSTAHGQTGNVSHNTSGGNFSASSVASTGPSTESPVWQSNFSVANVSTAPSDTGSTGQPSGQPPLGNETQTNFEAVPTGPLAPATIDVPIDRLLPTGAQVIFGGVTFNTTTPNTLAVVQSTDKAIVNWTTFDIGKDNTVSIAQPSNQSAMLARVTGTTDTRIAGTLTANGNVVLINPNGIAIGSGGRVDTGSFTASTLDIADADFLSGNMVFRRTGKAASVYNGGTITTADGGNAVLLGSSVLNEGVVSARLGRVAMAAGDVITLDFSGENFLQIAVPVADAMGITDALGRPLTALVTQSGSTQARGGRIYLSAATARELMLGAVKVDGETIATTVRANNGRISLGRIEINGGDGLVQITGTLYASARLPKTDTPPTGRPELDGGGIAITGGAIGLGGTIDVSGDRTGGSVSVNASKVLSMAGVVAAVGLRGTGGTIDYISAGSVSENTYGQSDATGAIHGGTISLTAGGDLATSGTYRANGLLGLGGQIDITGAAIRLLSTGLEARGYQQGGLIRVGGSFQGGAQQRTQRGDYTQFEGRFGKLATLSNAATTFVNDGVTIDVASSKGYGGTAIIWSDQITTMLGAIRASGQRGGGYAEVSGKETLRYVDLANIDTGFGGNLLLDPKDIVIGDFAQASSWQYAAIIGSGQPTGVPDVGDLEANDWFGVSVALNAAGDRLAVGAFNDDGFGNLTSNSGSVRLYTFSNNSFGGGALAGTIGRGYIGGNNIDLGTTLEANDSFGISVSLNATGDRLAAGSRLDDGFGNVAIDSGSVRLFTFASKNFEGGNLAATIGRGYTGGKNLDLGAGLDAGDLFGMSVSLNAAGNRLAVGAHGDDGFSGNLTDAGAVRLFSFSDADFSDATLVSTIGSGYTGTSDVDLSASLAASDFFGHSVALNASGDRLAVGAYEDDGFNNVSSNSGSVRLFTFANSNFGGASLTGTIGRGYVGVGDIDLGLAVGTDNYFGTSVSLNAAGDRLASGAFGDNGFGSIAGYAGSVRLFTFADTNFTGGVLVGNIGKAYAGIGDIDLGAELEAGDLFGMSVALNAAGDRLASGAFADNGLNNSVIDSGSVRLFTFANTRFGGGALVGTLGAGYGIGITTNLGSADIQAGDSFGSSLALNAAGD